MLAGDGHVFGGDAHPALVTRAEVGGDIGQVMHVGHVDPGLGHGDDDIGMAEIEREGEVDAGGAGLAGLVDEVAAVTPMSTLPRMSSRAISEAGKKRTVMPSMPSMAPR